EPERGAPLAHLVHEKTGGNPFFIIQFMKSLADEDMVTFDHDAACWSWDLDRIHTKGFTDNVVDLMIMKLGRLPVHTQTALQQLACLGHLTEITTLSTVLDTSQEQVQAALWESLRQGLVEQLDGSYKFMHDRVQEAAYSLIPETSRTEAHLRIGRRLAEPTSTEKREEAVFDIVNQLNRGVALITSQGDRENLAELNLIAARRAKTSAAYASALTYLASGAALLPENSWEHLHDLTFALELNRAECEHVTGLLGPAEERLSVLATHAATLAERVPVVCLRIELYMMLDQFSRAIDVGLDGLRNLGMECSAHPSDEEVQREYERIWLQLGTRAIEDLVDLPVLSDPSSLATLNILTKVVHTAYATDNNLVILATCRAANLSLERGNSDASCYAYVWLAAACARFGAYSAGYRFGRVGYELVEKHGWNRLQPRTDFIFGSLVMPW